MLEEQTLFNNFKTSHDVILDQKKGLAYERKQDYKNALKAYNSAFDLAKSSKEWNEIPPNIFMRKAIIFRRLKLYDLEIQTIKTGISYGTPQTKTTTDKLKLRLPKAENLLEKNKK